MRYSVFFWIWIFLLGLGCQTAPKFKDDGSDRGVWEGDVLVVNSERGQKLAGSVQWVSDSQRPGLRIDVTALFGISVATLIWDQNRADLWVYTERKHYVSSYPQKLFNRLTKLDMDPKVFFSLLQKEPRLDAPWKCQTQGQKQRCIHAAQKISLTLSHDGENRRHFNIEKGPKRLKINLTRSKVEVLDRMFKKRQKSSFKIIRI